jgi:hypothetical protein
MGEHHPHQFIRGTGSVSRVSHHDRLDFRRQRAEKGCKQHPGSIKARQKNPFHFVEDGD